jgi:cell division protein FtsQ
MTIPKSAFFIGFVAIGMWLGSVALKSLSIKLMPIRYVRIEGNFQFLDKSSLKQQLLPLVKTGLFAANINEIQKTAKKMEWIDDAKVKRVWPDTLDIKLSEQQPVAKWGKDGVLNNRGELFKPANVEALTNLPQLIGPPGLEKRLFNIMQGLQLALLDRSLDLREFIVNNRRSWKLLLANGMELQLGRVDPLQKFQRLMKSLPILASSQQNGLETISKIDLRYPNGFAVTWKPEAELLWKDEIVKQQNKKKT